MSVGQGSPHLEGLQKASRFLESWGPQAHPAQIAQAIFLFRCINFRFPHVMRPWLGDPDCARITEPAKRYAAKQFTASQQRNFSKCNSAAGNRD